jgi:hypothetical protein
MNKIAQPRLFALLALLILVIVGALVASPPLASGTGPTLMVFDEDLSGSALGWTIAIPVLVLVGIVVIAVLAGAALIATLALVCALVLLVFALLLAFTPLAVFLAIPLLAAYGFVKLIQRDPRRTTPAA